MLNEVRRGREETIRDYLRDKPKGKSGRHEYILEKYGLDEKVVREAYADYVEYYGTGPEAASPLAS